ncbi:MAG: sensor histidine kinase [Clostridiaceae bacterium]|nr:sensor histidine kinase [Clostridiaceae bacterium]
MEEKNTLSFRARLLLGILAVAFVSLAIFFAGSAVFAVRMAEKNYARTVTDPMTSQAARFDDAMRDAYRMAVRAANDPVLLRQTAAYLALDTPDALDALQIYDRLLALRSMTQSADGLALYLPAKQQMVTSSEYRMVTDLSPDAAPSWVSAPQPNDLAPHVYWDDAGSVPRCQFGYFQDITDETGAVLARVCVHVDERALYYGLFEQSASGTDTAVYLLAADGTVVSSDSSDEHGHSFRELTGLALPKDTRTAFGSTGRRLFALVQSNFSGFSVLQLTGRASLASELGSMALLLVLLLTGVCMAAALFARTLSDWLYRPLGALVDAMARAGQGDMRARAPGGDDEFGALGDRFNQMMEEIDGLLDDLVDARVEKRQAEIEALQQQIKPHFMYNTLNTIKFAALLQGNEEIGSLLGSFIELLEASISKKGAFIPLADEIRLVEDYAALQKYRYMDSFTLTCAISPETADCQVPRLLLQPFVENAILHGIIPRRTDNQITVEGHVEHDMLHLLVADNGKGMNEEECRILLESDPDDNRRFTGIGMRNVRERLRLYYGDGASFSIHTAPGEGTCISLVLPMKPEETL